MMSKGCENCRHYLSDTMDCVKGNLKNENVIFEDGEWRVRCYELEEVPSD